MKLLTSPYSAPAYMNPDAPHAALQLAFVKFVLLRVIPVSARPDVPSAMHPRSDQPEGRDWIAGFNPGVGRLPHVGCAPCPFPFQGKLHPGKAEMGVSAPMFSSTIWLLNWHALAALAFSAAARAGQSPMLPCALGQLSMSCWRRLMSVQLDVNGQDAETRSTVSQSADPFVKSPWKRKPPLSPLAKDHEPGPWYG